MERSDIKNKFHSLIDRTDNETLLMKFYDLMIQSATNKEGHLYDRLTNEQKDVLMLAKPIPAGLMKESRKLVG